MTYLETLQDAIKQMHGCDSTHRETIPVREAFRGQTVWGGEVEVFDLAGHPDADTCFAWGHDAGEGSRYFAVLKIPPVTSPQTAVQAVVVQQLRSGEVSD